MKSNRTIVIFTLVGLVVLGLLFVTLDLLFGTGIFLSRSAMPSEEEPYLTQARACVQIGSDRQQAIQQMSAAWFHAVCEYTDGSIDDLFFFGSQNPREVEVVLIFSTLTESRQVVGFIGSVDPYMIHLYDRCTPSPSSLFDAFDPEPTPVH